MSKRFVWSDSQVHKLRSMALNHTMQEVAKAIGCSYNNVRAKARKLEIPFKKKGSKHHSAILNEKDVDLIFELRDEGLTQKEIAEKFEVSIWTIKYYCQFRNAV